MVYDKFFKPSMESNDFQGLNTCLPCMGSWVWFPAQKKQKEEYSWFQGDTIPDFLNTVSLSSSLGQHVLFQLGILTGPN
jgi:hypothetical protein